MKNIYLESLLELIAQKNTRWGHSSYWTHGNYKVLSEEVFKASGCLISEQTFKRLYGKVKTDDNYSPHADTLEALAQYCGFRSWDSFIKETAPVAFPVNGPTSLRKEIGSPTRRMVPALIGATVVVLLLLSGFFLFSKGCFHQKTQVDQLDFTFEGVVTEGFVPYTVIFNYDIRRIRDSVFFQAGGEPKELIHKDKHIFSSTFLTPNYYRGQLIIGNTPVKTIPLHNKSKHWIIGYNYTLKTSGKIQPYKPFFDHPAIKNREGTLYYPLDSLLLIEPDLDTDGLWTDIRYYNHFDAELDECIVEARFKCHTRFSFITGAEHGIVLSGGQEDLQLHFVQKGFESRVVLKISDNVLNGRYTDLALFALGDIYSWNEYRVEVVNKKAHIYINDVFCYEFPYSTSLGKLKGLRMSFKGVGALDFFRVKKINGDLVYEEEFN